MGPLNVIQIVYYYWLEQYWCICSPLFVLLRYLKLQLKENVDWQIIDQYLVLTTYLVSLIMYNVVRSILLFSAHLDTRDSYLKYIDFY